MLIPRKLIKFLEREKVKYEPLRHRTVFTAFDKSQTLGVPEKMVGKTLLVKIDSNFSLVLIGANRNLDKTKFKKIINIWRKKSKQKTVKKIGFASERWIKKNIKGVKVGAVPPFGNLWKITTFIDKSLFKNRKVIVNAGDYNLSIKISPNVFKKLIPDLVLGNIGKKRK